MTESRRSFVQDPETRNRPASRQVLPRVGIDPLLEAEKRLDRAGAAFDAHSALDAAAAFRTRSAPQEGIDAEPLCVPVREQPGPVVEPAAQDEVAVEGP